MNPKFLICQFWLDSQGLRCTRPNGHSPNYGRVVPHEHNSTTVEVGVSYLCREVGMSGTTHFVIVEKPCSKLLEEFLPALMTAVWKRGPHATSDIVAEVEVSGYGLVKSEWYESTRNRNHTHVSLKFTMDGEDISFKLEQHKAPKEIEAIRKRVRATVAPAVDLRAMLSRRRDSRRPTW